MAGILDEYRRAGCVTAEQVLELARQRGPHHLAEVQLALESGRENSTAMIVLPGQPPGKNVCAFIRSLIGERSKLIVAAQDAGLPHGAFERMLRASMPDVEKKLRVMDAGGSLADAVDSAERNRHYRPSQALEVYCDAQQGRNFSQEVRDGSLGFDPTVIMVRPVQVPTDDAGAIRKALEADDLSALHRVLDPHVFSSQDGIERYRGALGGGLQGKAESIANEALDFLLEQAQEFVVYHGSNRRIDSLGAIGAQKTLGQDFGPGMYFSTAREDAREHGINLYRATVRLNNPLVISQEMTPEMDRVRKALKLTEEDLQFSDEDGLWPSMMGLAKTLVDIGQISWSGLMNFIKNKMGHDGIYVPNDVVRRAGGNHDAKGNYVIVFDASSVEGWAEAPLREFLRDITPSGSKKQGAELLVQILVKNKHLLQGRGIDVIGAKTLGTGSNGIAWKLRDGRVLKVTTDDAEAHVASHIKGKTFKHIFKIFDVWAFPGQYNGHYVYGLLTEGDLEKPDKVECNEFDWAIDQLEDAYGERDEKGYRDAAHDLWDGKLKQVIQAYLQKPGIDAEYKRQVLLYVKKYDIAGMLADTRRLNVFADLHSGNFMRRPDGTFVLIDIGTGGSQESARPPFLDQEAFSDIKVPQLDGGSLNEFGTGYPGSGANGPATMRGSNSSSWSGGMLALKKPEQHVPEDENEDEHSISMDWGPGRTFGSSF